MGYFGSQKEFDENNVKQKWVKFETENYWSQAFNTRVWGTTGFPTLTASAFPLGLADSTVTDTYFQWYQVL